MKRARFAALLTVSVLLATTLSFQSCNVIRSILGSEEETNRAPTVSLSEIYGDYTATAGETLSFYANAYDADYDSLTYTWYVNGTQQYGAYSSSFSWNTSGLSPATYTISVTVSDGKASASASVYAFVTAPSMTATLTADDSTPYSDQTVTLTASTSGSGGSVYYTWYINDVQQTVSDPYDPIVYYTRRQTYNGYINIRVVATDSYSGATAEAEVDLYYTTAASLHISNTSGYTIYYVYSRYYYQTSDYDYVDWISSTTIPSSSEFKLYGITANQYDIKIQLSNGTWGMWEDVSLTNGYYRTAYINSSSTSTWSMSGQTANISPTSIGASITSEKESRNVESRIQVITKEMKETNFILDAEDTP